jgi:hypothetical protein
VCGLGRGGGQKDKKRVGVGEGEVVTLCADEVNVREGTIDGECRKRRGRGDEVWGGREWGSAYGACEGSGGLVF